MAVGTPPARRVVQMSDDPTPREWALERVREQTTPEPDGLQDAESNVWTGTDRLKGEAGKTNLLERGDVPDLVAGLSRIGDVVTWHGLVAPGDEAHVRAIVKSEAQAEFSRPLLVARCNQLLSGGES